MDKWAPSNTDIYRDLADYDRTIGDRAVLAVRKSLREVGLPMLSRVELARDDYGLRIDVKVDATDLEAARSWLAGFGRSYGSVRIFLAEVP